MRMIRRALMALLAALVALGTLSACADRSTASAASAASSGTPAVSSAASSTATSAPSSSTSSSSTPTSAALPKATCGGIGTRGQMGGGLHELDAGALACFRQAALSCSDASLLVTESGVDAGSSGVIALHRVGSACAVSVTEQSYVAPRPPSAISRFDCGQIHVDGSGETVDCGKAGGKFSIPVHAG